MLSNDSKYLETVNFHKYLANYIATKKAVCYDIGSQGSTFAVEDERSAATIMQTVMECDCSIAAIGDVLSVVVFHQERHVFEELVAFGGEDGLSVLRRAPFLPGACCVPARRRARKEVDYGRLREVGQD